MGREEEEGKNIDIITQSSVYLYVFISTYTIYSLLDYVY